jgi:hypothetical protein
MANLKTNIDFVNKLLNTKGLSGRQRFNILTLFKKEMIDYEKNIINFSDESIKETDSKNKNKILDFKDNEMLYHYPVSAINLLKLFTTNDIFKYTTHSWDRKQDGTEVVDRKTFASLLKEEFNKENFSQLKKLGLEDLYWTIHNYLFFNYELGNPYNNIGWAKNYDPSLYKGFKYGWGCSKLIEYYSNGQNNFLDFEVDKIFRPVEYSKEFYERLKNSKPEKRDIKPSAVNLEKIELTKLIVDKIRPEEIVQKPQPTADDIEFVIPIDELSFRYFEDFVSIFKKQIEFRNNDFHHLILSEFSKQNRIDSRLELDGLKGLDIYTDTSRIKKAIEKIARNTASSSRDKGKEIKITSSFSSDNSFVIIDINHVGSYSNAHIDSNPKLNLREKAGDIYQIRDYLLSLCDFSIISIFKDKDGVEKPIEIIYLSKERAVIGSQEEQFKLVELEEKPVGFTYRLKFYL